MRWSFLLCVAGVLLPTQPRRTSPGAAALIRKFEAAYRSSKTLRTTFLERYFDNGKLVRSDSGVAYFGKPGKMRWEYQSPELNLYVIDGKWSWFYVPADHTVTKMPVKQSSDSRTPFSLLAGEMRVSRVCESVIIDSTNEAKSAGGVVLRCNFRTAHHDDGHGANPKNGRSETENSYALFELDPANGNLLRVLIVDPGGVTVEFQFANWEFNPNVNASMFQFHPEKGVAIVNGDFGANSGTARPAEDR